MDERLREVAAQLALVDVELLGEQARWTAGGAVALKPARRADVIALLGVGQRHQEAAEQERALGLAQRPLVGSEAVAVAVLR